jgi:hypothetical protein
MRLVVSLANSHAEGLTPAEVRLIAALEADARGDPVLAPYQPGLLKSLPRHPETIVTVLHLSETARDLQRQGMVRYAWTRARSLGFLSLIRLLLTGIRIVPEAIRMGMGGLGLMVAAAEMCHIASLGFNAVALHWELSDFVAATSNWNWLSRYIGLGRRYGLSVGLCSNDLRRVLNLAGRLPGLDFVIGPLSASGFRMTPDKEACEAAICRRTIEVIPHLGAKSTLDPRDREYAEDLGLTRIVVEG